MKNVVSLFILLLLSALFGNTLLADHIYNLSVTPNMIELKIGSEPIRESIRLKNNNETAISLKATINNWTLDEKNNLITVPSDAQSLDRGIVLTPEKVTIEPGKEAVLHFTLTPQSGLEPGEHRAIIYLTEIYPTVTGDGIEITFRQGVGIYGYSGQIRQAAELKKLTFDTATGTLNVDIENTGNVHTRFDGDYAIWKKGTFPGFKSLADYLNKPHNEKKSGGFIASGSMNRTPVLAGNRRTIKTILPIADLPAAYTLVITGTLNGKKFEKILPQP
jgi:P pilus assembly chaperone PapD